LKADSDIILTGNAGSCTNSAGTLSFSEIEAILKDESRGATQTYDEAAAVQIVTFDDNQWVSYDNWVSFDAKMDYANSHCIGGYVRCYSLKML
jgi:chitinase